MCLGVYGLDMALGSPSANGQGCVSVLQIVWHEVSRTEVLGLGWGFGLVFIWSPLGELLSTNVPLANVLFDAEISNP